MGWCDGPWVAWPLQAAVCLLGCSEGFGVGVDTSSSAGGAGGMTSASASTGGSPAGGGGEGGGGASGKGGAGGAGLGADGLVVRYFIDEAAAGQRPTELLDAAPDPQPLAITWGAEMAFDEDGGHRCVRWTQVGQDSRASAAVDGSKIYDRLQGTQRATIEMVVSVEDVTSNNSRFVHVGEQSSVESWLTVETQTLNVIEFSMHNNLLAKWPVDLSSLGRAVFHLVLDTTLADGVARVQLYVGGEPVVANISNPPPLDLSLDFGENRYFVLGNREVGDRTFIGCLYYAAVYDEPFDHARVMKHAALLLADDDG